MMSEIEVVRASTADLEDLRRLAITTFRETFAFDNTPEQLQGFFDEAYTLPILKAELEEAESETYFILLDGQKAGFLKVNWGAAQTEQELDSAFEIQRVYILQEFQGLGLGKYLFEFALDLAQQFDLDWVWLGVWERNIKAQSLYGKYGFEKFAEHSFFVGDKVDTDWLLRKSLK